MIPKSEYSNTKKTVALLAAAVALAPVVTVLALGGAVSLGAGGLLIELIPLLTIILLGWLFWRLARRQLGTKSSILVAVIGVASMNFNAFLMFATMVAVSKSGAGWGDQDWSIYATMLGLVVIPVVLYFGLVRVKYRKHKE